MNRKIDSSALTILAIAGPGIGLLAVAFMARWNSPQMVIIEQPPQASHISRDQRMIRTALAGVAENNRCKVTAFNSSRVKSNWRPWLCAWHFAPGVTYEVNPTYVGLQLADVADRPDLLLIHSQAATLQVRRSAVKSTEPQSRSSVLNNVTRRQ